MQIKIIKHEAENDITIFEIEGEIDFYNSPKLRQQLSLEITKGSKKIAVDFVKVKYIDSSGLATLIEGLQKMKKQKGQLKLYGLSKSIMDIFDVSKLDGVFSIYCTKDDAVCNF